MIHQYNIEGLKCSGCIAKAKSALLSLGDITDADLQLVAPQAKITMLRHIPTVALQTALEKAGPFHISESESHPQHQPVADQSTGTASSWLATYKPVLILGAFLLGS